MACSKSGRQPPACRHESGIRLTWSSQILPGPRTPTWSSALSDEAVGFSSTGNSFQSDDGAGTACSASNLAVGHQPHGQPAGRFAASPDRTAVHFAGADGQRLLHQPAQFPGRFDLPALGTVQRVLGRDGNFRVPERPPGRRDTGFLLGQRRESLVQDFSVQRRDFEIAELRLRRPGAHAGAAVGRSLAVVGVVDDQLVVEPELNARPFAAGADAIPAAGFDLAVVAPRDAAPAVLAFDPAFQGMADVAPAAEVGPVELLVVQGPHENQKSFVAARLAGFDREFVIRPLRVAEQQPHVGRPAFLGDQVVLPRPGDAGAAALEAAVPNQLAPQPAVAGVVDVFEEMTVDLFVNAG